MNRPLLEFDMIFLLAFLPAIQSAELVLFPVQMETVKSDFIEKDKFFVKRISRA